MGSSPLTNLGHASATTPHTAPDGSEHTGGEWEVTSKSTSTKGGSRTFNTNTKTGDSDKEVVVADDTTVNNEVLADDKVKVVDTKKNTSTGDVKKPYDPMNDACSEQYIDKNGTDACDKYTKKRNKTTIDPLKPLPLEEIPNEYGTNPGIKSNTRLDKPKVKESSKITPDSSTVVMGPEESTTPSHVKIPKPGKPARTKTMKKNKCTWQWKDSGGGEGGWVQKCGAYG